MRFDNIYKVGEVYEHCDRKFGVGRVTPQTKAITSQNAAPGEVFLDFACGVKPVSVEYLRRA